MAASTYHFAEPEKLGGRRVRYFGEQATREALRRRGNSNWGAWALTCLAIMIGAVGGSQLAGWSENREIATVDLGLSQIQPANGGSHHGFTIERAGDGNFYADVEISDQLLTMRIDPFAQTSKLSAGDRAILAAGAKMVGDVMIVPALGLGDQTIEFPAFLPDNSNEEFSVVGLDLLARMEGVRISPTTIRIAP